MNSYVTYTIKKLLLSLFTIFAVSVFSFAIVQLTLATPSALCWEQKLMKLPCRQLVKN